MLYDTHLFIVRSESLGYTSSGFLARAGHLSRMEPCLIHICMPSYEKAILEIPSGWFIISVVECLVLSHTLNVMSSDPEARRIPFMSLGELGEARGSTMSRGSIYIP